MMHIYIHDGVECCVGGTLLLPDDPGRWTSYGYSSPGVSSTSRTSVESSPPDTSTPRFRSLERKNCWVKIPWDDNGIEKEMKERGRNKEQLQGEK